MGKTFCRGRTFLRVLALILAVVSIAVCQQIGTIEGTFNVFVEDRFDQHVAIYHYQLRTGTESLELKFPNEEDPRRIPPGSKISVTGNRLGSRFTVSARPDTGSQTLSEPMAGGRSHVTILSAAPNPPLALGVWHVAIILVNFTDDQRQILDKPSAGATLSQTSSFYQENSYGRFSMTGDVFGYFTLPMKEPCNDDNGMRTRAAVQALKNSGVDVSGYQSLVVVSPIPADHSCGGSSGVASLGPETFDGLSAGFASLSFTDTTNTNGALGLLAHELGHNLRLQHSKAYDCGSAIYNPNKGCPVLEYGDRFDVMGSGVTNLIPNHVNASKKDFLGWNAPLPMTETNVYSIGPIEQNGPLNTGLKISPAESADTFYVEYRQPIGFDANFYYPQGYAGALIHLAVVANQITTSYILNMHPPSMDADGPTNPALYPGEMYVDYANRFSITTISVSPAGMQVRILVPPISSPTLMFVTPADGAVASGTVSIRVDALDRAGVSKVDLYRDGTLLGTQMQSPYQFSWVTSQETLGVHKLTATAYNPSNNTFSQSIMVTVTKAAAYSVSAAAYGAALAPESIASAFGADLATSAMPVTTLPLPTTFNGTTVKVKDSAGVERLAPLFYVGPTQVNYEIPAGTATGQVLVTITSGDGTVSTGLINVTAVAPALFSANGDGQGPAAGLAIHVKPDKSQTHEFLAVLDATSKKFVPLPINLGPSSDRVYLQLYGSGIRGRSALTNVTAMIGGTTVPVAYAGPQGTFVGLDQINVGPVPRSLIGAGVVNIILTVDGQTVNTVQVDFE